MKIKLIVMGFCLWGVIATQGAEWVLYDDHSGAAAYGAADAGKWINHGTWEQFWGRNPDDGNRQMTKGAWDSTVRNLESVSTFFAAGTTQIEIAWDMATWHIPWASSTWVGFSFGKPGSSVAVGQTIYDNWNGNEYKLTVNHTAFSAGTVNFGSLTHYVAVIRAGRVTLSAYAYDPARGPADYVTAVPLATVTAVGTATDLVNSKLYFFQEYDPLGWSSGSGGNYWTAVGEVWIKEVQAPAVRIFPSPKEMTVSGGRMTLADGAGVVYATPALKPSADLAASRCLQLTGRTLTAAGQGPGAIVLSVDAGLGVTNGYTLNITPSGVQITGQSVQGVYVGVQSLGWLMREAGARREAGQNVELPCLAIRDWPDVLMRGMTLQWSFGVPSREVVYDTAAVLAALKYTTIVPEFGPMLLSDRQRPLFTADSWITRAEFRAYVAYCRGLGLEVVPYLNALAHVDRGMPWPSRLGGGLDMGVEANYQALFDVLEEYIEDCPGLRYFHFGMDEANDCLSANASKYGRTPADLLAGHINRITQFCRERGIKPVIYHDMLLGSQEAIYGGEGIANGTELQSYLARPSIGRDVVLDYWNYEPYLRYPTVEGFFGEGFGEIWLTPWAGYADYTMPRNAYTLGAGVMGSTWSEVDYTDYFTLDGSKPQGMIYTCRWLREAIGTLAQTTWTVNTPAMSFDASLAVDRLYWERGGYGETDRCVPIPLAAGTDPAAVALGQQMMDIFDLPTGAVTIKGIDFTLDPQKVLSLGNFQPPTAQEMSDMMAQPRPWTIWTDGAADKQISGVNIPRSQDQVILYTRDFGSTTGSNSYGREVNVRCGQTHYTDVYGVGNMAIPRNGYVISGHGTGVDGCAAVNGFHGNIKIMDSAGHEVPLGKRVAVGAETGTITVNKGAVKKLIFLQTTAFEAAHYMPYIAKIEMVYSDGTKDRVDLRYGRDIVSFDDGAFLYGPKNKWPAVWAPGAGPSGGKSILAYEWTNPNPQKTVARAVITVTDTGRRIGYLLLGVTAVVGQRPGDANLDGKVDVSDLGILAANYGITTGATWATGDFNADSKVDVSDLGILAANYGSGTVGTSDFNADARTAGLSAGKDEMNAPPAMAGGGLCGSIGIVFMGATALMAGMLDFRRRYGQ